MRVGVRIDDPLDPRIADYRDIRERDLVGRRGYFVAEGEVVINVLLNAPRHRPHSVLIADKRLEAQQTLLAQVPDDVPIYTATQAVMDEIAGFPMHRGLLAIGKREASIEPDTLLAELPERAVILVLIGIANHDNMGGLFRAAAAFGADAVLLDSQSCDPLYRKSIRVSVGAALKMPFCRLNPGTDPITLLASHGFTSLALSPAGSIPLAAVRRTDRVAVILGTEGSGLPRDLLDRSMAVGIPMADGFDSLNVAMTDGIVLHHLQFVAEIQGLPRSNP